MGKLWLNSYIVSRWIKFNTYSLHRKLRKYGYVCKTNKQSANTSVFRLFCCQGVASKAVQWGKPVFQDSVSELSLSGVLYDKGSILTHDYTYPYNPLWRKNKTMYIIRYTNSKSAKSRLKQMSSFRYVHHDLVFTIDYASLFFSNRLLYGRWKVFLPAMSDWWSSQKKYCFSTLWVFA